MSESTISKTEFSESPSSKKPKLGDESSAAPSPASCSLLLSSFGYGSAGVKSHMEDAHIMFDEYVQTAMHPSIPLPHHFRPLLLVAFGQCFRPA
jgi:hypothetical protein